MVNRHSALYSARHPGMKKRLQRSIEKGCAGAGEAPLLFFRADDIGVPSSNFSYLIKCFQHHRLPLCLATVPAWTTRRRIAEFGQITSPDDSQWCWHQHGRLHRNFEKSGKKQEFGPSRPKEEIFAHLKKGRNRLEELLGKSFTPVFTPPWNRCSNDTLRALVDLDFKGVSRSLNAAPPAPGSLPEFSVNVDLHTRKEVSPSRSLDNLLREIEQSLLSGFCGIMIHHQRMNRPAFDLLDLLLGMMQGNGKVIPVHFRSLIEGLA